MSGTPTLPELLSLERAGDSSFIGRFHDHGRPNAYGGLVVSQALAAGMRMVPEYKPHSLHAYFLLPGDATCPVTYDVESVHDGRSFRTRRIQATQHGRIILTMMLSFQATETGLEHQDRMPNVPAPEDLPSGAEVMRRYLDTLDADDPRRRVSGQRALFEMRHIYPGGFLGGDAPRSINRFWFRAVGPLPADPMLHICALAYASDFGPLVTALLPHGKFPMSGDIRMASIDHAMWFHREAPVDEWLLYDLETPSGQGGRGLGLGKIFARDGRLLATTAQEGLMREIVEKAVGAAPKP